MKGFSVKTISYLMMFLFVIPTFAGDFIKIHVKTKEKTAACLGFTVDGSRSGSLGKTHMGRGPVNKEYVFGYRHSPIGEDITCGTKVLTKDSVVTLVSGGGRCSIIVD